MSLFNFGGVIKAVGVCFITMLAHIDETIIGVIGVTPTGGIELVFYLELTAPLLGLVGHALVVEGRSGDGRRLDEGGFRGHDHGGSKSSVEGAVLDGALEVLA